MVRNRIAGRGASVLTSTTHWSGSRTLGDLLQKRWADSWVTVLTFVVVVVWAVLADPRFLTAYNLTNIGTSFAIFAVLSLALAVTVIGGGIDVSVVGTYAVISVGILYVTKAWDVPFVLAVAAAPVAGAVVGAFNAALIVRIGMRPLLTTLVVLLMLRAVLTMSTTSYVNDGLGTVPMDDALWTFLRAGSVAGLPVPMALALGFAVALHVVHTRTRLGSQFIAVGASERVANEAGIATRRLRAGTYVLAGALAGVGGVFSAVSLNSASSTIGVGREFAVLAVLVLAGVSLLGGVGTIPRVMLAAVTITVLDYTLSSTGRDLNVSNVILGCILLGAMVVNAQFAKHRARAIQNLAVVPAAMRWSEPIPDFDEPDSVWTLNDRLTGAQALGRGFVEGPEDCIVGPDGALYCGDRRGWIWRMSEENFENVEVFARLGGPTLGLVFDHEGYLLVCSTGRGIVRVSPDGQDVTIADRTQRSWSIKDDRRLRLVDDIDITPDGRIWFSEASKRFDLHQWMFEVFEGRPNGRLVCHDPSTGRTRTVADHVLFPNGVCSAHDGTSLLVASTTGCGIYRYTHSGPDEGRMEVLVEGLPGYVDNINRSADGCYWVGFVGIRNPAFDVAMADRGFKRRMINRLPADEWMLPNLNLGCLIKIDEDGRVLECLWDRVAEDHSVITSMREHDGHLYIGGLTNDRVGRVRVDVEQTCRCGQAPCRGGADDEARAVVDTQEVLA